MTLFIGIAALIAFLFELYVSVRIVRCRELETIQKAIQLLLVWLIPLVAAIGILIFIINIEDDDGPGSGKGSKEFGGGPQKSISNTDAYHGAD